MPDVVQEEHDHKSSGIAKAGFVTGIIGTAGTVMNAMANGNGLFGLGGGNQKVEALQNENSKLRDENLLLKANANTAEQVGGLRDQVIRLQEQNTALRTELNQAFALVEERRQNLKQWTEDNFVRAKKCVDAREITPPVMVFPFGNPSNSPVAPPVPYPFVPPYGYPPIVPPANGGSGGTVTQSGGTTQGS